MEYREEMDEEAVNDNLMKYSLPRRGRSETDHQDLYSQWGPNRPRPSMLYPKSQPSKCESFR